MIRPRPAFLGTLAVAALAPLAACSAAPQPGDRTAIVASTSVWGDLARHVTEGTDAEVTSIITGNVADPHHFSPSAADMARAHRASFVVVGGGGYDAWLYEGLEDSQIVHALPLTAHSHDHEHGHEHDHGATEEHEDAPRNEHVWFDVDALATVAGEIEERVPGPARRRCAASWRPSSSGSGRSPRPAWPRPSRWRTTSWRIPRCARSPPRGIGARPSPRGSPRRPTSPHFLILLIPEELTF